MTFKQLAKEICKEFEVGDTIKAAPDFFFGVIQPGDLGIIVRIEKSYTLPHFCDIIHIQWISGPLFYAYARHIRHVYDI